MPVRLRTPRSLGPVLSSRGEYSAECQSDQPFQSNAVRQQIPAQIEHHLQYMSDETVKMINLATRERHAIDCAQRRMKVSLVNSLSQSSPI